MGLATQVRQWEATSLLRQFNQADLPFLKKLYGHIREPELSMAPFSEREKLQFIDSQFNAQHNYYCQSYCTDDFYIIEIDGVSAGRFFIDFWDKEIRIVDISLLPEFRNIGLGTYLLNWLFTKATKLNLPVTIHVEQQNIARRWYQRLGFNLKSQPDEVYLLMIWTPEELQ